jgi:EAL domain-containing protein (putative c-di-GMP-specific phosphodiesterase class I)
LIQVASRLAKPLRTGDTVGRLGGDEFGILVNDVQDRDDPLKVASRILSDFQEPLNIDGRELTLTTSVGITFSDVGYAEPDEVLRDADLAMYAAKSSGAAGYRVFEPSMRASTAARLALEDDLRQVLDNDGLLLVYQPIINLRNGRVEALEALLRWRHPERGLLQPCDFLPQAEEAGLAKTLTEWVLDQALADSRKLQGASLTPALCINLSGRHFSHTRLEEVADSVLSRPLGRSPNLWLDVTENALADHPQAALAVAERLRSSGMVLVLDDFGSGFSSLTQLRQLPLDILKLDRSFVQDAGDGERGQLLVAAMVALAKSFGLRSCAEGIESRSQLQSLGELGCDLGQGRFISPPLPLESVLELLIQDPHSTGVLFSHRESKGNPPRTLP